MALRNILAPHQQVTTASGAPAAGGKVFLFEPGTTTFVSSFQDSGLVTPHSNPVRLSGSGRANIWISRDVDMFITDRNSGDTIPTNILSTALRANPDSLGADETGGLVPNGSFENDTDVNDVPDGYVEVAETGSNNGLDTSQSTDGGQSFRFTSSGSGGGSLTTQAFFPVNDTENLRVNVDLRSTIATVRNIVRVEWYDVSQVLISNSDPYDSTANPLTFTSQQLSVAPPSGARFAKIRLIGCDPSVAVAGSTFFDRLQVFYPALVTGVFDNLLLSGNEIESTNTNGNINLRPNGTGAVTMDTPAAIRSDGNTDTEARQLRFEHQDGTLRALMGHSTADVFAIENQIHSGNVQIAAEDGSGTRQLLIEGDPDGVLSLYADGNERLRAELAGAASIRSVASTDAEARLLEFQHQDGTRRAFIGQTAADLLIENEIHGGQVIHAAEDAGGVRRLIFVGDGDGSSTLYGAGVAGLAVAGNGNVDVNSPGNTDTDTRRVTFSHLDGTRRAFAGHAGSDIFQFRNEINGGNVRLVCQTGAGGIRVVFEANPDVGTSLFHGLSNNETARTVNPNVGGLDVNNTLTGGGFERVLTASDGPQFVVQGPDDTVNNSVTLVSTDLTLSNLATGHYRLDMMVLARDVNVSNCGIRIDLSTTGVGTTNGMRGSVKTQAAAGAPTTDLQGLVTDTFQFPSLSIGSATDELLFVGYLEFVSGTNSVTVQFAQNTAQVGDLDFETGSFLALTRLGS